MPSGHHHPRKQATIRVMVAVLAAKLGGCRTVLVFEDAHWMDPSSWALLHAMLSEVRTVCLLIRYSLGTY
jgi:predicted ATPase